MRIFTADRRGVFSFPLDVVGKEIVFISATSAFTVDDSDLPPEELRQIVYYGKQRVHGKVIWLGEANGARDHE